MSDNIRSKTIGEYNISLEETQHLSKDWRNELTDEVPTYIVALSYNHTRLRTFYFDTDSYMYAVDCFNHTVDVVSAILNRG